MIMTSTTSGSRFVLTALLVLTASARFGSPARAQATSAHYVVAVEGMACPFCVFGLERELKAVDGVAEVAVSLGESRATVDVRPGAVVQPEVLRSAIREAGFTPGDITLTLTAEVRTSGDALSVVLGDHALLSIVGGSALSGLRDALTAGAHRFEITSAVVRRGDHDALEVSAFRAR